MAYGATPQTDATDAVRALVGDTGTSTSTTWLDDAEYDFYLSLNSNRYIAAAHAANALAGLFTGAAASASGTGYASKQVGDLKITKADATQAAKEFRSLASQFGRMAAAGVSPSAGGISDSDRVSYEQDTDRIRPAFVRRLFDSAQVLDPAAVLST